MALKKVAFKENSIIYSRDEEAKCFYFILHGEVELYNNRKYGLLLERNLFVEDIFGYEDYFSPSKRKQQAVAVQATIAYEVNRENFREFLSLYPSMSLRFKKELTQNDENHEEINNPLHQSLDEIHEDYLYTKEVDCPICQTTFKVNQIRYSSLQLKRLNDDFRSVYYHFDDLWYQIWRCPYCRYINFSDKFDKLNSKIEKLLTTSLPRNKVSNVLLVKKNLAQILDEYYELSQYIDVYKMRPMTVARIWQSIAWILEDLGDLENVAIQYDKLMDSLVDAWSHTIHLQEDIELKLAYKVALIHEKNGDIERAMQFLYKAGETKNAKKILKHMVADKLYTLREKYRESKNQKTIQPSD